MWEGGRDMGGRVEAAPYWRLSYTAPIGGSLGGKRGACGRGVGGWVGGGKGSRLLPYGGSLARVGDISAREVGM